MRYHPLRFLALLWCILVVNGDPPEPGFAKATPTGVVDLNGTPVDPFAKKDAKLVVLFFISIDCPISQRYSPEIQRLEKDLAGKGVALWLVQPNHDETAQATRAFLVEYRITTPLLRDPAHQLVRKAKATTTPEVAVFSADGELLYHGRIDNLYADFGLKRQTATEHDLRDAISALLQGRPVPLFHSPAVGCSIRSKPDA